MPQILSLFELQLSIFRSSWLAVRPPMASREVPGFSSRRRQPEHHLFYLFLWWYFSIQWTLSLPPLPMCLRQQPSYYQTFPTLFYQVRIRKLSFLGSSIFASPTKPWSIWLCWWHQIMPSGVSFKIQKGTYPPSSILCTRSGLFKTKVFSPGLINSTLSRSVPPYIVGLRRSKSI